MFYFLHDQLLKTRDAFLASADTPQDNLDLAVIQHCFNVYALSDVCVNKVISFCIEVARQDVSEDEVRADLVNHVNKYAAVIKLNGSSKERSIPFAITHEHGSMFMTRDGSNVMVTAIYVKAMMQDFAKRWQGRAKVTYLLSEPLTYLEVS